MESHVAIRGDYVAFSFREKFHCTLSQDKEKYIFYRTANRHRWARRVDEGDREKEDQGTRQ
jgi:hypothetical protein